MTISHADIQDDGIGLAYAAFAATPVSNDPFPHLTIPGFVPAGMLRDVVGGLPPLKSGGSFPTEALRLGQAARTLMTELHGPRFRHAVAAKFGLDLTDAPTMVTLRGWSREKDGRIHCDSTAKRVTVLLYLNPDNTSWQRREGCLRLLRDGTDIENFAEEVAPTNGTLLVFPNGPTTWHGHRRYVGQRHVVQLNYMTNDDKARHELRRHKISAFFKRFRLVA